MKNTEFKSMAKCLVGDEKYQSYILKIDVC